MSDFANGVIKIVYIYDDGIYKPIGCLTSNSFSESSEFLETTTRQNTEGWKSSIPTQQSYTISLSGLLTLNNRTDTLLTYRDLQKLKRDKTLFSWKINTQDPTISDFGSGYIASLSNNAEIDSFMDFSAEIIGYGQPYESITEGDYLNYTLNKTI